MASLEQFKKLIADLDSRGRNIKAILARTGLKRYQISNAMNGTEKQIDLCYEIIRQAYADELAKPPVTEVPTNSEMLVQVLQELKSLSQGVNKIIEELEAKKSEQN